VAIDGHREGRTANPFKIAMAIAAKARGRLGSALREE
jgi:hypothetical protein